MQINTTDTAVNIVDPKTNQTVETAPAKYVFYTFIVTDESGREQVGRDLAWQYLAAMLIQTMSLLLRYY